MQEIDFNFSADKNAWLIDQRRISFEEVIAAISGGSALDIIDHPNQAEYGHQKMYVVHVRDYVYLVPFVEQGEGAVFLKTIIPSRKAKKMFLKGDS
jgi:hypothetical protein